MGLKLALFLLNLITVGLLSLIFLAGQVAGAIIEEALKGGHKND